MNEAQLLAGAQVQHVSEDSCPLWPGAALKVLPDLGEKEVFVIGGIAPVRLAVSRTWRSCRRGRRWRRARELLVKIRHGRRHVGSWRSSHLPRLLRQLFNHSWAGVCVKSQFLAQYTSPPLGQGPRSIDAVHSRGIDGGHVGSLLCCSVSKPCRLRRWKEMYSAWPVRNRGS